MKSDTMIPSPKFEVNLGGIELTETQAQELEKAIQQTALQFLAKLDNGFLKDSIQLIPNDTTGVGGPATEFAFDKRWWFGLRLIRQLREGQGIVLEVPRGQFTLKKPKGLQ